MWGSAGLSVSGNTMVEVLIPWLVLSRTGSAAYAGVVYSAALAAAVVALVGGGALLDRWDRRNLSIGADTLSAVAVVAIPVIDRFGGLTLLTITVLVAVGALFDGPGQAAREALRPPTAKATGVSLEKVTSYGELMDVIGEVAGPALAGLAVATIGLGSSFWLAGVVFVVAAAVMWGFVPSWPANTRSDESYLRATLSGLRAVWDDRVLRDTGIVLALYGLFISPIVLVLATEFESEDRATALGIVIAAFAVGAIAGTALYARLAYRLRRRIALLGSFALASIGLALMAFALGSLPALLAIAAATGFASGPINPVLSLIMLDRATDEYRGRVISTLGALWLVAGFLSVILAGLLIEATSVSTVLIVIGMGSLAVTAFAAVTPGLRHLERRDLVPDT